MRKLICILMSLLLIFSLASCTINIVTKNSDTSGSNSTPSATSPDNTTVNNSTTQNQNQTPVGDTDRPDDSGSAPVENVNNGVLKEASPEKMSVPKNMQYLGTNNATEENNSVVIEATAVLYTLDGDVVNWTTENDHLYVITSGNNRLVIIDSKNMCPVYNTPLSGVPAEMNIVGDKIYISFPDLCRIDIFSKSNCQKESSIYFDHEVSSFCVDGDTIYYSEHDQWCHVYKKNLTTGNLTMVKNSSNNLFYYPKLLLNKEDGILYIGESKSSGNAIYYYSASSLMLKSFFKKDNYGITNHTREIFHIGDEIFWGNYHLSDTNAQQLIGRYGTATYGSVVFASNDLVSTYEGLFLTDTYECVVNYFESGFGFEHVIVTDSYNIFFRKRIGDQNIIVGVNFTIQSALKSV